MLRTSVLAALLLLTLGFTRTAADEQLLFMPLPPTVLPNDVGASAFAITGSFFSGGAFYWMPTSGTTDIGGLAGVAVSLDGKTIVGRALDARGFENAAVWRGGKDWLTLGSFGPEAQPCDQSLSAAYGASNDGRVIVGLGWDGCRYAHAFRYESATGVVDLGSLTANSTRANNISGDASVVIGWQEDAVGFRQGAKWIELNESVITGPNGPVGEALGVNHDGSIIVGASCNPSRGVPSAWMWTVVKGLQCFPVDRPSTLPNLPYKAAMQATSDDGRVVGGALTFGLDSEALIWLDGHVSFLQQYLREHGFPDAFRGWVNTGFVTSVSPDGRTLVGYGAGPVTFQGYVVILPEDVK